MNHNRLTRRDFVAHSTLIIGSLLAGQAFAGDKARPPRILLRSSWQTVNIGDVAHTPGLLHLLEASIPGAEIYLWPGSVDNGVEEMLQKRFPKLVILKGSSQITQALTDCDFLVHGSGPYLVAADSLARWRRETGKPYGIFGITVSGLNQDNLDLLNGARFVYLRDSVSLKHARDKGCRAPVVKFGPDAAFATDLRNDKAAIAWMEAHHLEEGKFLCCIPRLRFTPYWEFHGRPFDQKRHDRNEAMKEHDHAPLREAVIAVTQQTDLKVLLCPEDKSQIAVAREMIYDKLPENARAKVVLRGDFWNLDEALSTYVRSAGLFGNEMHSPIMSIGNGIPAIVCRFAEQTSKGIMWRDIGLDEWLFDLDDENDLKRIAGAVLAMAEDPAAAKAKAAKAREFVGQRFNEAMLELRKNV
jgi:polysaccharide pyruvyl transferase WcaK-like protein